MIKNLLLAATLLTSLSLSAQDTSKGSITCVGKLNSKGQITQPHYPKTAADVKIIASFNSGKTCSRNKDSLKGYNVTVEGVNSDAYTVIRALSVTSAAKGSALYK